MTPSIVCGSPVSGHGRICGAVHRSLHILSGQGARRRIGTHHRRRRRRRRVTQHVAHTSQWRAAGGIVDNGGSLIAPMIASFLITGEPIGGSAHQQHRQQGQNHNLAPTPARSRIGKIDNTRNSGFLFIQFHALLLQQRRAKNLITPRRKTPRRALSAPQDTRTRALAALLMLALLFGAVKIFSRLSGAETVAERWRNGGDSSTLHPATGRAIVRFCSLLLSSTYYPRGAHVESP